MRDLIALTLLAAATTNAVPTSPPPSYTPKTIQCRDLTIHVSASASQLALPSNLTLATLGGTYGTTTVSGTYNVSARYCEPTVVKKSREHTLQLLVHGISYTKNYFSGLAPPGTYAGQEKYSWIEFAAQKGYPTLSIDRLCNGNSSHPDGISACQLPLQADSIHPVIQAARSGSLPGISKSFNKVVYVGHSYGSLVANAHAAKYPSDADAYVLTGFSFNNSQSGASYVVLTQLEPAATYDSSQYSALQPSYLIETNATGTEQIFYYGLYSKAIAAYDFAHRGTVTLGELSTTSFGQVNVPAYKGAVFVVNGNEDAIFCSRSQQDAIDGVPGNCKDVYSSGVRKGYPNAREFEYFNAPLTGHVVDTHYSAQVSFAVAHTYLAKAGF